MPVLADSFLNKKGFPLRSFPNHTGPDFFSVGFPAHRRRPGVAAWPLFDISAVQAIRASLSDRPSEGDALGGNAPFSKPFKVIQSVSKAFKPKSVRTDDASSTRPISPMFHFLHHFALLCTTLHRFRVKPSRADPSWPATILSILFILSSIQCRSRTHPNLFGPRRFYLPTHLALKSVNKR